MAVAKRGKKNGRPSVYTQELADGICQTIASSSKSVRKVCSDLNIPYGTVLAWLSEGHPNYKEDFAKQYARAKEMQADFLAEEIIEISDDGSNDTYEDEDGVEKVNHDVIQRSRLRVDARKWYAGKLRPKKYGDKMDITSDGERIAPIIWQETKTYDTNQEADTGA